MQWTYLLLLVATTATKTWCFGDSESNSEILFDAAVDSEASDEMFSDAPIKPWNTDCPLPGECTCYKKGKLHVVDCWGKGVPDSASIPKKVNILKLNGNDGKLLTAGYFDNLVHLKKLKLGNMGLTSLPDGIFDNLSNLKVLNLSSNSLGDNLSEDIFAKLPNLVKLYLEYNGIKDLSANIPPSVTQLYLKGNQLVDIPRSFKTHKFKELHLGAMENTLQCAGNLKALALANNYPRGAKIEGKCIDGDKVRKISKITEASDDVVLDEIIDVWRKVIGFDGNMKN